MKYELSESGDISILELREQRLIYENLDPIQEQFISLVESGKRQILIDLSGVEYIDSFAVGFIMDMYRRLSAQGGSLRLSGLQARVKKILTITRVDNVIDIHPNIDDAIKAFES
ncbi:MAG TPA: STAS domain-containing protein [Acidobacteriota bacterium]|nr:STAS domain-containing protein [Acidobacteriota bacterium]